MLEPKKKQKQNHPNFYGRTNSGSTVLIGLTQFSQKESLFSDPGFPIET